MIVHEDRRYAARCDRCTRTVELPAATTLDGARAELEASAWMEVAKKGKGRSRWHWWCPECKPKPSTSMGRTT